MRTRAAVWILLLIGAQLAGCALTDIRIKRPYTPAPIEVASPSVTHQVYWQPPIEVKGSFDGIPEAVGVKKNGYGSLTAFIWVEPNPTSWLTGAVAMELERAGLELTTEPDRSIPRINVTFEQFFVEPAVSKSTTKMTGMTIVDVRVELPSLGKAYERRFVGEETTSEAVWDDSDYRDNLIKSAQKALLQAATATRDLIEKHAEEANDVDHSRT